MKYWLNTLLCIFLGTCAIAQDMSTLYMGRYPLQYPFKYNGTFYQDNRIFSEGTLFYNGKVYENVLVNIDAYKQEVHVFPPHSGSPVVLYREQTSWWWTAPLSWGRKPV